MGGYEMKREEEIKKEANRVSFNGDEFSSFIQGAEYADKTMIDKICEWLDSVNTDYYMDSGIFQMNDLISDLRKYLEE